jgi:hypothetical protein
MEVDWGLVVEWRGGRESSSNLCKILQSVAMQ